MSFCLVLLLGLYYIFISLCHSKVTLHFNSIRGEAEMLSLSYLLNIHWRSKIIRNSCYGVLEYKIRCFSLCSRNLCNFLLSKHKNDACLSRLRVLRTWYQNSGCEMNIMAHYSSISRKITKCFTEVQRLVCCSERLQIFLVNNPKD